MKYTEEFKTDAIKMVLEQGLTQTEVARRLEIKSQNLSRWIKETQQQSSVSKENKGADSIGCYFITI